MLIFIALFIPFLYLLVRRRFPPHFSFELPSEKPPAVVGHIVNTLNVVTPREFIATLVDLAYRKKIELKVVEKDKLQIKRKSTKGLLDFERDALDFIMKGEDEVILEDRVSALKSEAGLKLFTEWSDEWKRKVNEHCEKYHGRPTFRVANAWRYLAAFFGGMALASLSYIILVVFYYYPFSLFFFETSFGIFILLLLLFAHYFLTSFSDLTEEMKAEKMRWLQLKETIDKYTLIRDKPPTEHIIWDKLMAYAVVLNSADNVYEISKEFLELRQLYEYKKTMKVFKYFDNFLTKTASGFLEFFLR